MEFTFKYTLNGDAYHFTISPISRYHPSPCTFPRRAASRSTTPPRTTDRRATTLVRIRAFYRWSSLPHRSCHRATWKFPCRAFCCPSSGLRTPCRQSILSSRTLPSCCCRSFPRILIHQAKWISPFPAWNPHSATYLSSIDTPRRMNRQSIFQYHSHAEYPRTIRQYNLSHHFWYILLFRGPCHPSTLLRRRLRWRGLVYLSRWLYLRTNSLNRARNLPRLVYRVRSSCHCWTALCNVFHCPCLQALGIRSSDVIRHRIWRDLV